MKDSVSSAGELLLNAVFLVPPRIREAALFGDSRLCVTLQKALRRALGGSFLVTAKFQDGPLRGQSFACWTSEKYFILGSHFEEQVQRVIAANVRPGDVIYDIGAHAGYMTLLFSTLTGPDGRIFTFEPSPLNYARVRSNVDENRSWNVTLLNLAASNHEGDAQLIERGSQSVLASADALMEGISSVRTIRLDNFVDRDRHPAPDLIKMDVEGHGGQVLEGAMQTLKTARPKLICELHDSDEETRVMGTLAHCRYQISAIDYRRKYPRQIIAKPK